MSNPFAAFEASDDEDNSKPTVVKASDKHHRSNQHPTQLTRNANNKKRPRKRHRSKLQHLHHPVKPSPTNQRRRDMDIWSVRNAIVSEKNNLRPETMTSTTSKGAAALVESNSQ